MNKIISKLSVAVLAAATALTAPSIYAQSQNVLFGRTNITLDTSFLATFDSVNANVSLLDGTALNNGSANFSAVTGTLNTSTLVGEIFHSGGYLIRVGGSTIRLQNFDIDTTNTSAPVISALLSVNENVVGRIVAFSELGNNFNATATAGSAQLTGINLFLSPALANNLNSVAGQQVFSAGQLVGTDTQIVYFASTPTGSN